MEKVIKINMGCREERASIENVINMNKFYREASMKLKVIHLTDFTYRTNINKCFFFLRLGMLGF